MSLPFLRVWCVVWAAVQVLPGAEALDEWPFVRSAGVEEGGAVLGCGAQGAFDDRWAACPTVVVADGVHRMWYSSWFTPGFGATGIGLASSVDGVHWVRENAGRPVLIPGAADAFDSACVFAPEVQLDGAGPCSPHPAPASIAISWAIPSSAATATRSVRGSLDSTGATAEWQA